MADPPSGTQQQSIHANDIKSQNTTFDNSKRDDHSNETDQSVYEHSVRIDHLEAYFGRAERAVAQQFEVTTHGCDLTPEQSEELSETFVADSVVIDRLLHDVERTRILLLTGNRGVGKNATSQFVASRLTIREGGSAPLMIHALDQNVAIDVRALAKDSPAFRDRAVVFCDTFMLRNRDLMAMFGRSERFGWESLAKTLRDRNAYLLFTMSKSDADSFRPRLAGCVTYHEVTQLPPALVSEGLDRQVQRLRVRHPERAGRLDEVIAKRETVIKTLGTLPNVATFLTDFVSGNEDLATTLRNAKNIDEWFLSAARTGFDTFCFLLTLALAHPTPDVVAIPWLDFEQLRRAITDRLKSSAESAPQDSDGAKQPLLISDRVFLESCRAEIVKDRDRLGDVVRFIDDSYPADLWKTLLFHQRRVLTYLVPALRQIVEEGRPDEKGSLRALAAQIIGRIGEIDPFRLFVQHIRRWSSSNDRYQRPFVGRLVQGVIASGSRAYRDVALREVALLADFDQAPTDEAAQDRLVTAISAYSQIGAYVPEFAMEALGNIAVDRLAPAGAAIHETWRKAEEAEQRAETATNRRAAVGFARRHRRLVEIAGKLSDDHATALIALEMAIVQLCLLNDPIKILTSTREWIARGGVKTGLLVAVLFLHDIADELHELAVTLPDTNARFVISPLLVALDGSPESVHLLSEFLSDVHGAISQATRDCALPADLQTDLQKRFLAVLTAWSRSSADTRSHRPAMLELFGELARVRGGALRRELYELLQSPEFQESEAIRNFAVDARKRVN